MVRRSMSVDGRISRISCRKSEVLVMPTGNPSDSHAHDGINFLSIEIQVKRLSWVALYSYICLLFTRVFD